MTATHTQKSVLFALIMIAGLFVALPASAAFTVDLEVGSRGTDVSELQAYLAADATLYPEGLVTGYFGVLTEAAVMRFQARYGIAQVGRVGPITRAKLNELGASGTPPQGTGADVYAPIIGAEDVTVSSNTATIKWATTESARHRVMYATSFPFLYASASSVIDANFGVIANVTLTGLTPNTTYYYVRESIDASGNIMWTTHRTFTTN